MQSGGIHYVITANLNYAMLTAREPRLPAVNAAAALVLADGMPLVWASRWTSQPLPERVAGSDLVPGLCARSALRGYRVFLLGGDSRGHGRGGATHANAVARAGGRRLGVASVSRMSESETAALIARVRVARPDILFVSFGQPRGELWIADHCARWGCRSVCRSAPASISSPGG